jgi:hypothetical protein
MPKRSLPDPKKITQRDQIVEATLRGKPSRKKTGEQDSESASVTQVAQSLRHLPRAGFQARLRKELEGVSPWPLPASFLPSRAPLPRRG